MSRANLNLDEIFGKGAHVDELLNLGRQRAREWLKNPTSDALTMIRLDYQDQLTNSIKWAVNTNRDDLPNAIAIVEYLGIYNAGIDEVLEEFISLALAVPVGAYQ